MRKMIWTLLAVTVLCAALVFSPFMRVLFLSK